MSVLEDHYTLRCVVISEAKIYPWCFCRCCNARLWAELGGNPALQSNLQLVSLPSETAEPGRPEEDVEGLGDLGSFSEQAGRLWGGPGRGLANVSDQGPLSQEQQAEVGSARQCLGEARSPLREFTHLVMFYINFPWVIYNMWGVCTCG